MISVTTEQEAALGRAVGMVVRYFERRCPADPNDIAQEAWVAMLGAVPKYNPAKGCTLETFAVMVARRHVGQQVGHWMAVPSVTKHEIAKGGAAKVCTWEPLIRWRRGKNEMSDPTERFSSTWDTPEQAMISADGNRMRSKILRRHREVVVKKVNAMKPKDRKVGEMLVARTDAVMDAVGLAAEAKKAGAARSQEAALVLLRKVRKGVTAAVRREFTADEINAAMEAG